MDARGNKLSSWKIPNQYLKNRKVIKLFEIWQLWLKRKKKRKQQMQQSCYFNSKKKRVIKHTLKYLYGAYTAKKSTKTGKNFRGGGGKEFFWLARIYTPGFKLHYQ